MAIGAAGHVFKNPTTKKVATQIDLNGTLADPNVSNWQAFVEVVRNASIKAILPPDPPRGTNGISRAVRGTIARRDHDGGSFG